MEISEIINKEEFSTIIINELKNIGVKYRKEKKSKIVQDKSYRKRIFRTHLHLLELADVILANGRVVQIPKFVADACNRILEQVETEGIFRKAGSSIRQKEIRISLEAGVPLGKSHHAIDVANVVKFFFRELPEPLIPPSMQETLLRSLLIGEHHVKAILLTCLLLPPLTINTLSFFMQFLYTVSLSDQINKMSIGNLAIIFTPGLMPLPNINSHRFTNHVKMVRLLIENANAIGTIPNNIASKLQRNSQSLVDATTEQPLAGSAMSSSTLDEEERTVKKKKKRRSGSLTQMFIGLRKIVGSAIGSSEHLDHTPSECKVFASNRLATTSTCDDNEVNLNDGVVGKSVVSTPCHKTNKKRRFADPVCAFSAKKKRDLLAILPSNSGGFLPNTPMTKEPKKSRLSLGGSRHIKNITLNPVVTSMERRWSIVGSGWSKNKNKHASVNKHHIRSNDCIFDVESTGDGDVVDANNKTDDELLNNNVNQNDSLAFDTANNLHDRPDGRFDESTSCIDKDDNCLKISKNDYEEIKERVAAIESRISHEFGAIPKSIQHNSPISVNTTKSSGILSGPERVQTQYERIVVETEALSSPATEQLAQRLSRGLKIRRSIEQRVIRSPSARKIGTIRRRSQENMRLPRNSTLHLSSTNQDIVPDINSKCIKTMPQLTSVGDTSNILHLNSFYAKGNLRRGKPNILHTGLLPVSQQQQHNSDLDSGVYSNNEYLSEQWMSGEEFFSDFVVKSPLHKFKEVSLNNPHVEHVKTPGNRKIKFDDVMLTPMLPPKSLPRKAATVRTPAHTAITTASELPSVNGMTISTPIDEDASGRSSIARLRTQNVGMVMAKAKLFDSLGTCCSERRPPRTDRAQVSLSNCQQVTPNLTSSENSLVSINTSCNMSAVITRKTTLKSTPIAKRIQSTSVNSPTSSKRRQHLAASKYIQKQMIQSIVTDEKLIKTRHLNSRPLNRVNETIQSSLENFISSPRTSKTAYRTANSPRRIKKHNNPQHNQHTKFRTAASSPSGNQSKRTLQQRNSTRKIASKDNKPFAL